MQLKNENHREFLLQAVDVARVATEYMKLKGALLIEISEATLESPPSQASGDGNEKGEGWGI